MTRSHSWFAALVLAVALAAPAADACASQAASRSADSVAAARADYFAHWPARWWAPVPPQGAPEWEILPQAAGPGEVIVSKRHELGLLSNFAATPFAFRGRRYASLEGFWQMMLYPEGPDDPRARFPGLEWPHTREQVAHMTAFDAKRAGALAEQNMTRMGIGWVSFEGRRFAYRSTRPGRHYRLIVAAMREKVRQNTEVRRLLLATGDLILKPDHHEEAGACPEWRYCEILMRIRSELLRRGGSANGPDWGTWRSVAPMRHARAAHAVVSTGTAIFALAGTGAGHAPVLEVERFDGRRWTDVSTLPVPGLNAPAAVALGGRIYLIGGFETVTNVPTGRVHVYDPATRAWSEARPLPAPRGGHAAVVMDGRIHVIGGGNSQATIADHSVYDPATDSWSALAPLPRAEGSPAAVALGGRLYAIGGRSGPADFGAVDIYDPATDSWSAGPEIYPRGTAGAVAWCEAIYLFGGESQARAESLNEVLWLEPGATAWELASPMPTARNFARAVLFRDAVYVVGGSPTPERSHASEGSAVVERFQVRCGR
jgi:N-acetylneuraminic acid mutarotase/predicted NAD-dependent protein-ADP-ribosyltransferase YbiA (DUF1768 family)